MREIKFRVWDKKYKTFDYNSSPEIFISTDGELFEKDERVYGMQSILEYSKTDDCELMQFTGLHDRTGVEIYEGDILETDNSNSKYWVVGYKDAAFTAEQSNENYHCGLSEFMKVSKVEVVGNIYENSELLEVK